MSAEARLREEICRLGKSIFDRGLTHGSTGNVSAKSEDGWLLTPTGSNLGRLDPARLAKLDWQGQLVSGDPPSKEAFLHLAMYQERPSHGAVVHLHSTHSVAVSVLAEVNPHDVLPALTAYYVMRIGNLPLVPYYAPGDMLLANHGPVVGGSSLAAAADAVEELEATAKLYLLVRGQKLRPLGDAEIADIRRRYPIK
jgi:3-dehydro-4-phosphotetronate decarboxylase